jgi:hypothetical protein
MQNRKHALIFFASIRPTGISTKRKTERITDYSRSLEIIHQFASQLDFDIYVIENTLGNLDSWENLNLPIHGKINFSFMPENSGEINKGMGELDMASSILPTLISRDYEKVIWFSGRHLLTSEGNLKVCLNSQAELIVSNPDFYFLGGEKVLSEKNGLLNDMLFGISLSMFQKYVKYFESSRHRLSEQNIGSEQLLYQFVTSNNPTIEWMMQLGVLRRENKVKWHWFETSEWHFC